MMLGNACVRIKGTGVKQKELKITDVARTLPRVQENSLDFITNITRSQIRQYIV